MISRMLNRERLVFPSAFEFADMDIESLIEVYCVGNGDKRVIKVSVVDCEGNVVRYNGKNQMSSKMFKRWKWSNYEKLFSMIGDSDCLVRYVID